ncbi:MAG: extracellular solute-binding protein [Bacillota bacterium]|jgi:glucose/mannose transport system substrate-binding protein|nr:extracellular solute-binding protein [Bacillota bacterium]HHT90628.1 extracellular solute-binding protein [Bacillota bacterium]
MKRRMTLVLISVLLVLLIAGMSVSGAELWHYWLSGGEREALDAFLSTAREQYPDVEFTERGISGASTEMRRQLGAAFLANDPPNVYQSAIGYDLKSYVDAGRLAPIDDVWEAINGEEVFSEGLKSMVKFDGHAYAIPLNTHIVSHIFYNKHIFDQYELDIPTTWDEFKAVSEALRANGIEPFAAASGWETYNFYAPLVSSLGPEGYLALGNGQVSFTDPKVKEAFRIYGDAFVSAYMFGWSGYGWAEAANEVINGNAAMYLNGDWVVAYFESAGWVPGEDFWFFPAPGTQDVMIMQVDALAAPAGAADPEGTAALLTVAGGVSGQSAFNAKKGSVAANLNTPPDIYNTLLKATYDRVQQVSAEGTMLPNMLFMLPPSLYQELGRQVSTFAMDPTEQTLEQVTKTLENMRQDLLEEGAFVNWNAM